MKIIHLSDLHFHRGQQDNQAARKTLDYVAKNYPKHYVVVTGDITDDGDEVQYENAYKALKGFAGKLFVAPGNHDFGAVGSLYSRERAMRFDEMISRPLHQGGTFFGENNPVVNVIKEGEDQVMFIALDTNLETEECFDFACGEVGEKQLATLKAVLDTPSAPDMWKVLFFHHHPFTHSDPFMELKDARALARTVFGKVDVIMFGHMHVMNAWHGVWGAKHILASDNSPGKNKAGELVIENGNIEMNYVDIA